MAKKTSYSGGAKASYGDGAQAVTANRLDDGVVVYLTAESGWAESVGDATWTDDKDEQKSLVARAQEDVERCLVVSPYLFDVAVADGRPKATSNREIIRSLGPTNRTDLGKQAELER